MALSNQEKELLEALRTAQENQGDMGELQPQRYKSQVEIRTK